jgi:hypothetical protein
VMLVEVAVLGGDHCVYEVRRNLLERHEFQMRAAS